MADGESYTANAQRAAALASTYGADKCPHCDKQGLPVLLTIPTLADRLDEHTPTPAALAPLLKGNADPVLTDATYVLRTLRPGYVMAWYETPPWQLAHEQGWTIAQVHDGGYLTTTSFAALGLGDTPGIKAPESDAFSCSRVGGYAAALLFVIPYPERAGKVWVAFSSHPWSERVRARYARSPALREQAMTCIDAARAGCERSMPLSEANLRSVVVDFSRDFDLTRVDGNPFPLRPLQAAFGTLKARAHPSSFLRTAVPSRARPEDAPDVLNQARLAQGYPEDDAVIERAGLIVSLADPEGVTTAAAQRRITLANTAAEWLARVKDHNHHPDGYRRLQSALSVQGLLKRMDQQAEEQKIAAKTYASRDGEAVTRWEFERLRGEGKLPPLARFVPRSVPSLGEEDPASLPADAFVHGRLHIPNAPENEPARAQTAGPPNLDRSMQGQVVTRWLFEKLMNEGKLPPQTRFVPEAVASVDAQASAPTPMHDAVDGTIHIPTDAEIEREWADRKAEITAKLTATVRVPRPGGGEQTVNWERFLGTYHAYIDQDKARLARLEQDHKAWLQSPLFAHLYTHHFDDTEPRDGLAYARCINGCLMGGPLTEDALDWWQDYLADDPHQKSNLLVRALLGNQTSFFDWFAQPETKAAAWGELKGLFDIAAEARARGGIDTSVQEAHWLGQSLLNTTTAVAALRDKAERLGDTLRYQLTRLSESLMSKAEPGLQLYKLDLPVGVATRLWRQMAAPAPVVLPKRRTVQGRQVTSRMLAGATALDLAASPKEAGVLIEIYIWHRGGIDVNAWDVGTSRNTYLLTQAERRTTADPVAIWLTEAKAEELAKQSMALIKDSASGVLAAGSILVQALVMGKAWHELKARDQETRDAAAVALLTSGIGISAALAEGGMIIARRLGEKATERGLKLGASYGSAFASFIAAFQSSVSAVGSWERGNDVTMGFSLAQAVCFGAAAVAQFLAVRSAATPVIIVAGLGLSWTGIALIFLGLALITEFIIVQVKESPIEAWAAQIIWGEARRHYPSLEREQSALAALLMGAEVDFAYGSWSTLQTDFAKNYKSAMVSSRAAVTGPPLTPQTQEAWLRLTLPKQAKASLRWLMQIHAVRYGQGIQTVAQWGSAAPPSAQGDDPAEGLFEASRWEEKVYGTDDAISLILSVRLDTSRYRLAYGTVRVAPQLTGHADPLLQRGKMIIDEDYL